MTRQNQKIALFFATTLVAAVSFTAADTSAQVMSFSTFSGGFNKSVSRSYSRSVGNSYLGLTGYAYGYMRGYKADTSQMIYTSGSTTLSSANARGYLRDELRRP